VGDAEREHPRVGQTAELPPVLRQALQWYGRHASTNLDGLLEVLADLPDGVSVIANARERASRLRAGNFYAALEGSAFHKITAPWCLSHHPHSPLATEEVLELSRRPLGPKS
jgi:hypothetical protein